MNKGLALVAAVGVFGAAMFSGSRAEACGGCFVPPAEQTVVTGHRMAMSISQAQTVLWDQIQYAGEPEDFSWVLPVKKGTRVEVAHDAFFEALEGATGAVIGAPAENCAPLNGSGFGCSASQSALNDSAGGGQNTGVNVIHKGSVGPYETVTLSAEDPNALSSWLNDNGYSVPEALKPTIDAYVAENFDFIALRLQPGKNVQQMTPVRVVSQGALYTLPLRMVAAGAGADVSLVLYLIGEGRYEAANFANAIMPQELVTWDFLTDTSDYAELRLSAMAAAEGRTWLTSYALQGSMLAPTQDPLFGGEVQYQLENFAQANTIADAYFMQGQANGATIDENCIGQLDKYANAMAVVVEPCDENGENCVPLEPGQFDAASLRCGELDDIAVAFTGMHPRDVVLSRLEAKLPLEALSDDLRLQAAEDQDSVHNRFVAGLRLNACHDSEPAAALVSLGQRLPPGGLVGLVLGAAGLLLLWRRREEPVPARGLT